MTLKEAKEIIEIEQKIKETNPNHIGGQKFIDAVCIVTQNTINKFKNLKESPQLYDISKSNKTDN
jgi:hypothetical protein